MQNFLGGKNESLPLCLFFTKKQLEDPQRTLNNFVKNKQKNISKGAQIYLPIEEAGGGELTYMLMRKA